MGHGSPYAQPLATSRKKAKSLTAALYIKNKISGLVRGFVDSVLMSLSDGLLLSLLPFSCGVRCGPVSNLLDMTTRPAPLVLFFAPF